MDFCRNVTVSGDCHHHLHGPQQEQIFVSPPASTSSLDDLFSAQNTEVDVSLEWLSIFVEDCLHSTGNCLPVVPKTSTVDGSTTNTTPKPSKTLQQKPRKSSFSSHKFVVPGKARSKRKRVIGNKARNPLTSWSYDRHQARNFPSPDPPLLQQAYWLADSELIVPKKDEEEQKREVVDEYVVGEEVVLRASPKDKDNLGIMMENSSGAQQPRRCSHCLALRTPQWRAGPLGPKTLCNACGVRYKSGRLLPEYRPAKSPTFVSYLHSNSHKKVMEMRIAGAGAGAASVSASDADADADAVFNS